MLIKEKILLLQKLSSVLSLSLSHSVSLLWQVTWSPLNLHHQQSIFYGTSSCERETWDAAEEKRIFRGLAAKRGPSSSKAHVTCVWVDTDWGNTIPPPCLDICLCALRPWICSYLHVGRWLLRAHFLESRRSNRGGIAAFTDAARTSLVQHFLWALVAITLWAEMYQGT